MEEILIRGFSDYGLLGLFAILMLWSMKYLIKEYKFQNQQIIDNYSEQLKDIIKDKDVINEEKEEITASFLLHLKSNESKLLDIINENSRAFSKVAQSNESVSEAISLLVVSINKRTSETSELNSSIKQHIHQKI